MRNDELATNDHLDEMLALDPLHLAITALGQASVREARCAFREAVHAYSRTPSAVNALKVEAAALALREQQHQRVLARERARRVKAWRASGPGAWRPDVVSLTVVGFVPQEVLASGDQV
jgi:hypothetical protein